MADVKFNQLVPITGEDLALNDLIAISDNDLTQSKKITIQELQSAILTDVFVDNAVDVVNAINNLDYDGAGNNTDNNLNATNLFYNGTYQPASYFLDWTNVTNKPSVATLVSQLFNNRRYVRYDSASTSLKADFSNGTSTSPDVTIVTDFIPELSSGATNLWYTDERVDEFFQNNFADYYNELTAAFDNGLIRDSLLDTPATFINISQTGIADTIVIGDSSLIDSYQEGQILRVYGASSASSTETFGGSVAVDNGDFPTDGAGAVVFGYRFAQFDLDTGEISAATSPTTTTISLPVGTIASDVYEQFNVDYFITTTFSDIPDGKGLLVYRDDGSGSGYKLTAVLGPKQVGEGSWKDYYTFSYTSWSGKNELDNTYTSIIHFPLTPPTTSLRGWTDVAILTSVQDVVQNKVILTLTDPVLPNPSGNVTLCHNDTTLIQTAINANSAAGRKNVLLNAKTYITSNLLLPDEFSMQGTTGITKIVKLPWSGAGTGTNNNNLIKASTTQGATTISFVGMDIDGNLQNSFLFSDVSDRKVNYLINLGNNADTITFDRVRILNSPAGGVFVSGCNNLKITTCEIVNSGNSDVYPYSPLIADEAFSSIITANKFENYTDYVDVSLTDKGVVTNNIVNNCGSGLFVYGSRFMLSSPNVLVGPANEFLPAPDTLNSEYDLVNADLTQAYLAGADFESTTMVYQENGFPYDLTQTDVTGDSGTVYYTSFALQKVNGVEEFYTTSFGQNPIAIVDATTVAEKEEGVVQFGILSAEVARIKAGDKSYSTMLALNANHVGWVWAANYEHEVKAADVTPGVDGTWLVSPASQTVNPNTEFDYSAPGESISDPVYRVQVVPESIQYIKVGSEVTLKQGHAGFSANGVFVGTVQVIDSDNGFVNIKFAGAGDGTPIADLVTSGTLVAGDSGQINIIDKFVLAQGRIL